MKTMEGQKEYVCFCLGAIHLFLSQTFYRFDESFGTWSEIIYQCGIAIGKVFVVSTVPFVKQVAECAAMFQTQYSCAHKVIGQHYFYSIVGACLDSLSYLINRWLHKSRHNKGG